MSQLQTAIHEEASRLGFSFAGIARADPSRHMDFYRWWISSGHHGRMDYLARDDAIARRADLDRTMAGAASVVLVAHEYFQEDPPGVPEEPSRAIIARYARGRDYHRVVKRKLQELLSWLDGRVEGGVRGRAYVDTGPILERELARRAGLGWFGRNTMLIHPTRGSYFFLGLLLVDVAIPTDAAFTGDRCGTCRACLDACPTGALLGRDAAGAPVMDARLCISYLTIENRGEIPLRLRSAVGNRVFGCDICQEVCPFNIRFAREAEESSYACRPEADAPPLVDLLRIALSEGSWDEYTRGSPLRRAGRAGLARNVCVALGNWGSSEGVSVLRDALGDSESLVRGHAAWALGRVGSQEARSALASALSTEEDPFPRRELEQALGESPA